MFIAAIAKELTIIAIIIIISFTINGMCQWNFNENCLFIKNENNNYFDF